MEERRGKRLKWVGIEERILHDCRWERMYKPVIYKTENYPLTSIINLSTHYFNHFHFHLSSFLINPNRLNLIDREQKELERGEKFVSLYIYISKMASYAGSNLALLRGLAAASRAPSSSSFSSTWRRRVDCRQISQVAKSNAKRLFLVDTLALVSYLLYISFLPPFYLQCV